LESGAEGMVGDEQEGVMHSGVTRQGASSGSRQGPGQHEGNAEEGLPEDNGDMMDVGGDERLTPPPSEPGSPGSPASLHPALMHQYQTQHQQPHSSDATGTHSTHSTHCIPSDAAMTPEHSQGAVQPPPAQQPAQLEHLGVAEPLSRDAEFAAGTQPVPDRGLSDCPAADAASTASANATRSAAGAGGGSSHQVEDIQALPSAAQVNLQQEAPSPAPDPTSAEPAAAIESLGGRQLSALVEPQAASTAADVWQHQVPEQSATACETPSMPCMQLLAPALEPSPAEPPPAAAGGLLQRETQQQAEQGAAQQQGDAKEVPVTAPGPEASQPPAGAGSSQPPAAKLPAYKVPRGHRFGGKAGAGGLDALRVCIGQVRRVPDGPHHVLQRLTPPGLSAAAGTRRRRGSGGRALLQGGVEEEGQQEGGDGSGLQQLGVRSLGPSVDWGAMELVPVAGSHPTHHMHMVHPLLEQLGQVGRWGGALWTQGAGGVVYRRDMYMSCT
jgi:hypothetical protein